MHKSQRPQKQVSPSLHLKKLVRTWEHGLWIASPWLSKAQGFVQTNSRRLAFFFFLKENEGHFWKDFEGKDFSLDWFIWQIFLIVWIQRVPIPGPEVAVYEATKHWQTDDVEGDYSANDIFASDPGLGRCPPRTQSRHEMLHRFLCKGKFTNSWQHVITLSTFFKL